MPLPILSNTPKTNSSTLKSIKDMILGGKDAANDADISKSPASPERLKDVPFKKVTASPHLSNANKLNELSRAANQPNMGDLSFQRNQAANDKAIARSQGMMNPLITLIQNVNHTLVGIDKTLKSILSVLENKLGGLQSGMGDTGLGFGDIATAVVGGAVGAKVVKKGVQKGVEFFKGGPKVPPAAGMAKPGLFAKLFGSNGAAIADAAHGVKGATGVAGAAGAAEAGAAKGGSWFGKIGKAFGIGGNVLSKVAAPLTVAMTVMENMDELQQTGAVDPLKQLEKTSGGLGKMFNLNQPFFSMSRLEGAGEAMSGATGTIYGIGTQIGKAIHDVIPDDISDSIVDGIVGLFGGETNADRAKKQKEIEEKQAKDWEERKKIREAEKKKLEDEQKRLDEQKKSDEEKKKAEDKISEEDKKRIEEERKILMEGQKTASAGNKEKMVQGTATVEPSTTTPVYSATTPSITEATQKADMAVMINQPKDNPVPVVMTDEKGVPIINSVDRKEGANLLGGSTKAPAAPGATPSPVGQQAPAATQAAPAASGAAPEATREPIEPGKNDHTQSKTERSVSATLEELGVTPERLVDMAKLAGFDVTLDEAKNAPDKILAKFGDGIKWFTHQTDSKGKHKPYDPGRMRGGERGGVETQRTDTQFGGHSAAIEQAKTQAAAQDRIAKSQVPSTPKTTAQGVPGAGAPASTGSPTPIPGTSRTVSGSYTPQPGDEKYFKGDLSKLAGMDPVFVEKLKAASAEAGVALPLTSGFRSQEKQDQLRAEAVKKYGSEEAASKWVAKTSIHTTGNAADFSMGGDAKKFWDSNPGLVAAMEKQGLHRPLSHEAWHWESDVTKGQDRKGLAAKLIEQRSASLAAGTQPQPNASMAQTAKGVAAGVPAVLAAQGVPGAAAVSGAAMTLTGADLESKEGTMKSVYNSFINAGFSPNQAKAMTAEAGRENDFNTKTIFGSHTDAANSAKNIGYFSWQGDRATKLQGELEKKGLWKDGKAVQSQETLDTMAQFAKKEMESGNYKGIGNFLENQNVDSETAAKQLGKGYIKWAYGQDKLKSGKDFDWKAHDAKRRRYSEQIDKLTGQPGATKPASDLTPTDNQIAQPTRVPSNQGTINHTQSKSIRSVDSTLSELGLSPEMVKSATSAIGMGEMSVDDILTSTGNGVRWMLHQSESKGKHKPYDPGRMRRNSRGGEETVRTNSQFGGQSTGNEQAMITPNPITQNTVSGMVPPVANISTQAPPDIAAMGPRAAQNYNLLNMPNVQASLDALKAGGANIISRVTSGASSALNDGMTAVDAIRQSGGLSPMIGGDISGLVGRVAPELSSSVGGIKGVFDQSLSDAGKFARNFGQDASDALKGAGIPKAIDGAISTAGGVLNSIGSSAGDMISSMMGGGDSPLSAKSLPSIGEMLEGAGFSEKKSEIQAGAQMAMSAQSSGRRSGETRVSPERGSSITDGQTTPIEVRNPESSIRRLTDMLIAYTFG